MPFVRRNKSIAEPPERAVSALGEDDLVRRVARIDPVDELRAMGAGQADAVRVSAPRVLLGKRWAQNDVVIDRAHEDDEEVRPSRRRYQQLQAIDHRRDRRNVVAYQPADALRQREVILHVDHDQRGARRIDSLLEGETVVLAVA
jgi:hypothetical protein